MVRILLPSPAGSLAAVTLGPLANYKLEVTLTNGERRTLAGPTSGPNLEAAAHAFEMREEPFAGEWCRTTDGTAVARDHIVEWAIIQVEAGTMPWRLNENRAP
jgi:hypothetical protein